MTRIRYDEALPITARRDDIARAVAAHQVVVVAGETGSGKTTQLPKICLDLGRRTIAHTQPRRIAARTVAERIAEELQTSLGDLVGYQVRFTRKTSRDTRLKVMTDGVLLAEISRDRDLRRYDTIIIDEAHERSLNIDFLLGYLKQLLVRRPDLKVIVTSATIDTARFAAHFAEPDGTPAPVIEVSGRTYPVEVRYRPITSDGEADQVGGILDAVRELTPLGMGDILVFLSGEREIRDTAEALAGLRLPATEILPLYARLSAAEQHRVFAAHGGRRVVLATNVAETSLTVPGIRYVVDAGTARISRYSARTKVQRLPIEPVSRASANQRAGRCGRVAPGVCIRLYSEEDFRSRPEFTEPEILRTNLASVILQMAAAELGDIAAFPFVEAPDGSQIADGLRLLEELNAISTARRGTVPENRGAGRPVRLTGVGRRLAAIPVDPRMGRMLLAAERQGCLREMLVIVAGLSIQDPRERPAEQREAADAQHRRFWAPLDPEDGAADRGNQPDSPPEGDFVALLRLWDYVRQAQRTLSGNAFRRLCRDEFLHYLRLREWADLHGQLKEICRDLDLHRNDTPADVDRVHTAALAGLLSHVGLADLREEGRGARPKGRRPPREYLGARGTRFAINPGSSLARNPPPLVMAAEIVETSRLWARTVAGVTAGQVEEVGAHLLKRQYSEPHWSARAGAVMAYETVSLYGVPVVARRKVAYGKVNPAEARSIFLRAALVEGQWRTRHEFWRRNSELRAEVEALEDRVRRRDLVVDDETVYAFYDARIPGDVTSVAHFDRWYRAQADPDLLTMTLADLTARTGDWRREDFPDTWTVAGHDLPVGYVFDPASERDGVTVRVPVAVLPQLTPVPFSWQVPGLRLELATELIRSLPKARRRQLVPAPEFAARALEWLRGDESARQVSLPLALARALRALTGEQIDNDEWELAAVPRHLRVTFEVSGEGEPPKLLAAGKDLTQLKLDLARQVTQTLNEAAAAYTRTGLTRWGDDVPATVRVHRNGHPVTGYPALVDEVTTVGVRVFETAARAAQHHVLGLRRLVTLNTPDPTKWVVGHLGNADKLSLGASPYAGVPALLADARLAAVGELVRRAGQPDVRTRAALEQLCDTVRADLPDLMRGLTGLTAEIVRRHRAAVGQLAGVRAVSEPAAADLTEQLGNLVFGGFVALTPYEHLVDLPRYLQAAEARIATLLANPARDRAGLDVMLRVEDAYAALCAQVPPGPLPDFVAEVGWLLEELRVSLFAQPLRAKAPVSEKRVLAAVQAARARLS